jgi:tetratricopeptide (TPR) repeat protein
VPIWIVLFLFSIKTISRNPDWKDNLALFGADINHAPNSAKIHYYYGNDLYQKAMSEKVPVLKQHYLSLSKAETMRSIEINPQFFHAHYNLSLIYQEEGNADSSIYYLRNVLRIEPKHNLTYGAMGIAFGKMKGEYDSAIYYLKTAVLMNDKDEGSFENLGIAYAMKNDLEHAIPILEKAIALQPKNARVLMNLGVAYDNKGDKQKAQSYFDRAFEIDPSLKK